MKTQAFALLLQLTIIGAVTAQNDVLSAGVVTWDGGLVVRYAARFVQPPGVGELEGWTTGEKITRDCVARYFVDAKHGVYFGYELAIEYSDEVQLVPAKDSRYRVRFRPLSLKPEAVRGHLTGPEPVAVRLQSYPGERMIGDGDEIHFDIVPEGGRSKARITESIRFTWHPARVVPVPSSD